jgi:N-acetyl-1-D-myo-inositol-2-amino-2-deoxy-alpha-D-glucopyranoside deacetylase
VTAEPGATPEAGAVPLAARRVLVVHAHPDDEVITTGVALASCAAAPDTHVTLVTCTLGEEGEVLVPELVNLRADRGDQLGGYRIGELERACAALGVTDHRFLGGPGRWRDSGMMGTPANEHPRCFWRADPDATSEALVGIVREVRPQVLVSYDDFGGYGHPDHIRAHQVTVRAFTDAADGSFAPGAGPAWQVSKLYETAFPRSFIQAGIDHFQGAGPDESPFGAAKSADEVRIWVADEKITTQVEALEFFQAKIAAMRAHRTQMTVDGLFFALADGIGRRALATEHFVLARGERGPGSGPYDRETDLFAGLDL